MPYLEQIHFPISSAGNEPTRYQMLSLDLRNLALVPALAIRFGNDLRIGLAPGFLFSTGHAGFRRGHRPRQRPHPMRRDAVRGPGGGRAASTSRRGRGWGAPGSR